VNYKKIKLIKRKDNSPANRLEFFLSCPIVYLDCE
jgi:hypothetical protein